jgi:transposase
MKKLYIGLDTHKENIVIGIAFAGNAAPEVYGKVSADIKLTTTALYRLLKKYDLKREEVDVCYEAGPTGFVLARRLIKIGFDCHVVAPTSIPKNSDRVKTDRRDARKMARLLRSGDLTFVHIPSPRDEAIRDVSRARTDIVNARKQAKQQLGGFLLRNGHHYTGKSRWSDTHLRYLRKLVLPSPAQNLVLEENLRRIDILVEQEKRICEEMEKLTEDWYRKPLLKALMGFRGFKIVAATSIISELGDLRRFSHPRQLMAYIGLVPSEDSSGNKRRQGSITKCGNTHVRWMLVEIINSYRLPPKVGRVLSMRQEGLSRAVKEISWRAQNRLCKKYHHLTRRGLPENKIKVAVAREMLGFIWELGQVVEV